METNTTELNNIDNVLLKYIKPKLPHIISLSSSATFAHKIRHEIPKSHDITLRIDLEPNEFCVVFFDSQTERKFKQIIIDILYHFLRVLYPEWNGHIVNILFFPVISQSNIIDYLNKLE